jgi:hypothetical protein
MGADVRDVVGRGTKEVKRKRRQMTLTDCGFSTTNAPGALEVQEGNGTMQHPQQETDAVLREDVGLELPATPK